MASNQFSARPNYGRSAGDIRREQSQARISDANASTRTNQTTVAEVQNRKR